MNKMKTAFKLSNILASTLFLLLCSDLALATASSFEDETFVRQGESWDDNGIGDWVDTIPDSGNPFQIYGMEASFSGDLLNLNIFTDYNGTTGDGQYTVPHSNSNLHTYTADLFIDVGANGSFDYGVALSDHSFDDALITTSKGEIYEIIDYKTSYNYFDETSPENIYGKWWDNPWDNGASETEVDYVPVTIKDGNYVNRDDDFSWAEYHSDNPYNSKYKVSLSISLNDLGGWGEEIGLFFSSATCGNDIMAAKVNAPVPEPATMLLLGVGLLGIAGLGRRRLRR